VADVDIRDLMAEQAAAAPAAPAVIFPGLPPVSYRDLDELVQVTIERLEALGVTARDRIAVAVPDGPAGLAVLLAAMSLAVCAPINPLSTEEEFARALEVLGISVAVAPEEAASLRRAAAVRQTPVVTPVTRPGAAEPPEFRGTLCDAAPGPGRRRPLPAEIPEQLLLMTSGTTAVGKVVPLTVPNVLAAAGASARAYRLSAADRRLNCMPLFHVQGLVGSVITSLSAGSSVVCLPDFEPAAVLAALAEHDATWFSGTPAMHRSLLGAGAAAAGPFGRLRFVRCGSAWLPSGLRTALEDAYGVPVTESYGMTEAHQIASTPLPPDGGKLGMMPTGARVAVLTDDGEIAESPGPAGEVVVSGPNVARRYLWPPQAARSSFVAGWLRTGDCGRLERDGSLVLTGRLKELINRGGEKVYPREVEEVLLRHPDVGDAVVFGIPDPVFTEEVAAAVVPRASRVVSEPKLIAFARASLSPHKLPRRVIVRAELPAGATGKHLRTGLAERFAGELGCAWRGDGAASDDVKDALEAALAGMWAYLLGRPGVGRDSDFFALGGNSLLAASLLTMVGEFFRTKISSLEFYDDASTVAGMAALLRRSWSEASPAAGPARPAAAQAG
jgi:acyl-CoA synthetase (AMP-forming)/AMP-acid ligase II